ncbi:50S ribosomal protein-related [Abeliophyllum distichum]|uniref:50S ribosomal protein-related n=1 Tax=Abeliophyllum distichum TaxID=126358 RepID=A0ABD1NQY1_9LAMI
MATLQKFELLATECAVARSPTRSPTTSPLNHLRRRKTLLMLFSHGDGTKLPAKHDDWSSDQRGNRNPGRSPEKRKMHLVSHKLKDLFASSPPAFDERVWENVREGSLPPVGGGVRRGGARSRRPVWAAFRRRLLRRAWRPVLVTIPE